MLTIEDGVTEGALVAIPAINPKVFQTWSPSRLDHVLLYQEGRNGSGGEDDYRYRLTVVDRCADALQHVTAVVLIPAGRESEFIFASQRGLLSVAESAGCARLIAVAFGRRHRFESQQAVQEELTFVVQVLSQQGLFLPPAVYKRNNKNLTIPFMALDGIGSRNVMAEGATTMSGRYLVEQVKADSRMVRRLYFMDNPFVIQSEVGMLDDSDDVDKHYLAFDYHKQMSAGIIAMSLNEDLTSSGVVIGLEGGGLVNFLHRVLTNNVLSVVELDESVVTVAERYFGFDRSDSSKLTVHIGDGLTLAADDESEGLHVAAKESLNFIAVDVDSKDNTVGMSCPPQAFVGHAYLTTLKSLLKPTGLIAINVSARDPAMFDLVIGRVKEVFETVFTSRQDDEDEDKGDVNVVVFATAAHLVFPPRLELMAKLKAMLHRATEEASSHTLLETISELEDSLASLVMHDHESSAVRGSGSKTTTKRKGGNNKKRKGKKK
ncbi:methyltransferase [Fragilaria crotonensis]|nr:methyltransferase [Fragilaria crotonensis]